MSTPGEIEQEVKGTYHFDNQPHLTHVLTIISIIVLYVILIFPLYRLMGPTATVLSLGPVAAVGWFFGARYGLLAGLLFIVPVNTLILSLAGYQPEGWNTFIKEAFGPGLIALTLTGFAVGRMHDLKENVVREKNKVEAILASIGEGVTVIDKDGKILMFNKVAERISGYTSKEAIGYFFSKLRFIREKDKLPARDFIGEAITSGEIKSMERHALLVRSDKKEIPASSSAAPIRDTQNKIIGAVVVFRDTTKERSFEQMKDEFLNIAAHDLRTPINAIKGNAELILDGTYGKVPPKMFPLIGDIVDAAEWMRQMVNDFLTISRIERGKLTINPVASQILDLLEHNAKRFKTLALEKNLEFKDNLPKKLPTVMADRARVQEVLDNLVGNAIKFTQKGYIELSAQIQRDELKICVKNTGPSIPKEKQKVLFQKYSQIHSGVPTSSMGAGLGLGLYISRLIVESHKGRIWVESKKDEGATFCFTLPLAKPL